MSWSRGLIFLSIVVFSTLLFIFIFVEEQNFTVVKEPPSVLFSPPVNAQLSVRPCDDLAKLKHTPACYWFAIEFDQQGGFKLPVVVLKAVGLNVEKDPLVFISGGPGESGNTLKDSVAFWDDWLERIQMNRDFLLVDLRGTEQSVPSLSCDNYNRLSKALIQKDLTFSEEYTQLNPVIQSCLEGFSARYKNALHYMNSRQNADDLSGILSSLGYKTWNYLGVSYGTRVALVAALTQPQVNKILLDSPYPLDRGQLTDPPILWRAGLDGFLADQAPSVGSAFGAARTRLKHEPLGVEVEDWATHSKVTWLLNEQRFIALVYSSLYGSDTLDLLVNLITEIGNVLTPSDKFLLELFYNQLFDSGFNSMLYFATECNDSIPVTKNDFNRALTLSGDLAPLFESDWELDICRNPLFKPGQLPKMDNLSVPALVAVGELDPITTSEHAHNLMQWLDNGVEITLRQSSHAEFYSSECAMKLIPLFLSQKQGEQALFPEC